MRTQTNPPASLRVASSSSQCQHCFGHPRCVSPTAEERRNYSIAPDAPCFVFETWESTTPNHPLSTRHRNGHPILESSCNSRVGEHQPPAPRAFRPSCHRAQAEPRIPFSSPSFCRELSLAGAQSRHGEPPRYRSVSISQACSRPVPKHDPHPPPPRNGQIPGAPQARSKR